MPSFKPYVPSDSPNVDEKGAAPAAITETSVRNHNIKSIKLPPGGKVESHEAPLLQRKAGINYVQLRETFANRDQQKNQRFHLNDLSRGVMSVEQEENVRIEGEVQRRMKVVFESLYE